MNNTVIIYTSSNLIEGNLLKGLLEANGITARINGEYLQGGIGELLPSGHITLSVDVRDAQAARTVITDYENGVYQIDDDDLEP